MLSRKFFKILVIVILLVPLTVQQKRPNLRQGGDGSYKPMSIDFMDQRSIKDDDLGDISVEEKNSFKSNLTRLNDETLNLNKEKLQFSKFPTQSSDQTKEHFYIINSPRNFIYTKNKFINLDFKSNFFNIYDEFTKEKFSPKNSKIKITYPRGTLYRINSKNEKELILSSKKSNFTHFIFAKEENGPGEKIEINITLFSKDSQGGIYYQSSANYKYILYFLPENCLFEKDEILELENALTNQEQGNMHLLCKKCISDEYIKDESNKFCIKKTEVPNFLTLFKERKLQTDECYENCQGCYTLGTEEAQFCKQCKANANYQQEVAHDINKLLKCLNATDYYCLSSYYVNNTKVENDLCIYCDYYNSLVRGYCVTNKEIILDQNIDSCGSLGNLKEEETQIAINCYCYEKVSKSDFDPADYAANDTSDNTDTVDDTEPDLDDEKERSGDFDKTPNKCYDWAGVDTCFSVYNTKSGSDYETCTSCNYYEIFYKENCYDNETKSFLKYYLSANYCYGDVGFNGSIQNQYNGTSCKSDISSEIAKCYCCQRLHLVRCNDLNETYCFKAYFKRNESEKFDIYYLCERCGYYDDYVIKKCFNPSSKVPLGDYSTTSKYVTIYNKTFTNHTNENVDDKLFLDSAHSWYCWHQIYITQCQKLTESDCFKEDYDQLCEICGYFNDYSKQHCISNSDYAAESGSKGYVNNNNCDNLTNYTEKFCCEEHYKNECKDFTEEKCLKEYYLTNKTTDLFKNCSICNFYENIFDNYCITDDFSNQDICPSLNLQTDCNFSNSSFSLQQAKKCICCDYLHDRCQESELSDLLCLKSYYMEDKLNKNFCKSCNYYTELTNNCTSQKFNGDNICPEVKIDPTSNKTTIANENIKDVKNSFCCSVLNENVCTNWDSKNFLSYLYGENPFYYQASYDCPKSAQYYTNNCLYKFNNNLCTESYIQNCIDDLDTTDECFCCFYKVDEATCLKDYLGETEDDETIRESCAEIYEKLKDNETYCPISSDCPSLNKCKNNTVDIYNKTSILLAKQCICCNENYKLEDERIKCLQVYFSKEEEDLATKMSCMSYYDTITKDDYCIYYDYCPKYNESKEIQFDPDNETSINETKELICCDKNYEYYKCIDIYFNGDDEYKESCKNYYESININNYLPSQNDCPDTNECESFQNYYIEDSLIKLDTALKCISCDIYKKEEELKCFNAYFSSDSETKTSCASYYDSINQDEYCYYYSFCPKDYSECEKWTAEKDSIYGVKQCICCHNYFPKDITFNESVCLKAKINSSLYTDYDYQDYVYQQCKNNNLGRNIKTDESICAPNNFNKLLCDDASLCEISNTTKESQIQNCYCCQMYYPDYYDDINEEIDVQCKNEYLSLINDGKELTEDHLCYKVLNNFNTIHLCKYNNDFLSEYICNNFNCTSPYDPNVENDDIRIDECYCCYTSSNTTNDEVDCLNAYFAKDEDDNSTKLLCPNYYDTITKPEYCPDFHECPDFDECKLWNIANRTNEAFIDTFRQCVCCHMFYPEAANINKLQCLKAKINSPLFTNYDYQDFVYQRCKDKNFGINETIDESICAPNKTLCDDVSLCDDITNSTEESQIQDCYCCQMYYHDYVDVDINKEIEIQCKSEYISIINDGNEFTEDHLCYQVLNTTKTNEICLTNSTFLSSFFCSIIDCNSQYDPNVENDDIRIQECYCCYTSPKTNNDEVKCLNSYFDITEEGNTTKHLCGGYYKSIDRKTYCDNFTSSCYPTYYPDCELMTTNDSYINDIKHCICCHIYFPKEFIIDNLFCLKAKITSLFYANYDSDYQDYVYQECKSDNFGRNIANDSYCAPTKFDKAKCANASLCAVTNRTKESQIKDCYCCQMYYPDKDDDINEEIDAQCKNEYISTLNDGDEFTEDHLCYQVLSTSKSNEKCASGNSFLTTFNCNDLTCNSQFYPDYESDVTIINECYCCYTSQYTKNDEGKCLNAYFGTTKDDNFTKLLCRGFYQNIIQNTYCAKYSSCPSDYNNCESLTYNSSSSSNMYSCICCHNYFPKDITINASVCLKAKINSALYTDTDYQKYVYQQCKTKSLGKNILTDESICAPNNFDKTKCSNASLCTTISDSTEESQIQDCYCCQMYYPDDDDDIDDEIDVQCKSQYISLIKNGTSFTEEQLCYTILNTEKSNDACKNDYKTSNCSSLDCDTAYNPDKENDKDRINECYCCKNPSSKNLLINRRLQNENHKEFKSQNEKIQQNENILTTESCIKEENEISNVRILDDSQSYYYNCYTTNCTENNLLTLYNETSNKCISESNCISKGYFISVDKKFCIDKCPDGTFTYKTDNKCIHDCHKEHLVIRESFCQNCRANGTYYDARNTTDNPDKCINYNSNYVILDKIALTDNLTVPEGKYEIVKNNTTYYLSCPKKCKECTTKTINEGKCISCNIDNGYYPHEIEGISASSSVSCYKKDEIVLKAYFDEGAKKFLSCYTSCQKCKGDGNQGNHQCTECADMYTKDKDNGDGTFNCRFDCDKNYFYRETNGDAACLPHAQCSVDYPYLLDGGIQCFKKCNLIGENYHLYDGKCVENCPNNTVLNENSNICEDKIDEEKCILHSQKFTLDQSEYNPELSNIFAEIYFNEFSKYNNTRHITHFYSNEDTENGGNYSVIIYRDPECLEKNFTNATIINTTSCEEKLKSNFGLQNQHLLHVLVEEYQNNTIPTTTISYYNPNTGAKLKSKDICEYEIVEKKYYLDYIKSLNKSLIQYYRAFNIEVLDYRDKFYKDDCVYYENEYKKDFPMKNRINYVFPSITFCEDGCEIIKVEQNYTYCNCTKEKIVKKSVKQTITITNIENKDEEDDEGFDASSLVEKETYEKLNIFHCLSKMLDYNKKGKYHYYECCYQNKTTENNKIKLSEKVCNYTHSKSSINFGDETVKVTCKKKKYYNLWTRNGGFWIGLFLTLFQIVFFLIYLIRSKEYTGDVIDEAVENYLAFKENENKKKYKENEKNNGNKNCPPIKKKISIDKNNEENEDEEENGEIIDDDDQGDKEENENEIDKEADKDKKTNSEKEVSSNKNIPTINSNEEIHLNTENKALLENSETNNNVRINEINEQNEKNENPINLQEIDIKLELNNDEKSNNDNEQKEKDNVKLNNIETTNNAKLNNEVEDDDEDKQKVSSIIPIKDKEVPSNLNSKLGKNEKDQSKIEEKKGDVNKTKEKKGDETKTKGTKKEKTTKEKIKDYKKFIEDEEKDKDLFEEIKDLRQKKDEEFDELKELKNDKDKNQAENDKSINLCIKADKKTCRCCKADLNKEFDTTCFTCCEYKDWNYIKKKFQESPLIEIIFGVFKGEFMEGDFIPLPIKIIIFIGNTSVYLFCIAFMLTEQDIIDKFQRRVGSDTANPEKDSVFFFLRENFKIIVEGFGLATVVNTIIDLFFPTKKTIVDAFKNREDTKYTSNNCICCKKTVKTETRKVDRNVKTEDYAMKLKGDCFSISHCDDYCCDTCCYLQCTLKFQIYIVTIILFAITAFTWLYLTYFCYKYRYHQKDFLYSFIIIFLLINVVSVICGALMGLVRFIGIKFEISFCYNLKDKIENCVQAFCHLEN